MLRVYASRKPGQVSFWYGGAVFVVLCCNLLVNHPSNSHFLQQAFFFFVTADEHRGLEYIIWI